MLVENIGKEINLVDIEFDFHTKNIKPPFNAYNDIAYLLLDTNLHNVYLEKLPPYKRAEFIEVSKNLIKKLKHSVDEIGLKSGIETSRKVYGEIDKEVNKDLGRFGVHVDTYARFEDFNKNYFSNIL